MIKPEDISIVVQGAIDRESTSKCLESIHKYLPGAKVILSTWKGSEVDGMDYDILVLNDDPGAPVSLRSNGTPTPNNINRQLVSTRNGLLKVRTKYAFKLRSDLVLTNDRILLFFDQYQARDENYKFFDRKVIIPTVYTKEYSHPNGMPVPFHPSDWWFFGLTTDLLLYFQHTPLADENNYFCFHREYKYPERNPYPKMNVRFHPEQYYFIEAFKQKFDIDYEDFTCWNENNCLLGEKLLLNNFIILDGMQSGIFSNKHLSTQARLESVIKDFKGLILFDIFEEKYRRHCVQNMKKLSFPLFSPTRLSKAKLLWKRFFNKEKFDNNRRITIFGIKISYKKKPSLKIDYTRIRLVEIEIFSYCNRKCWFCPNSFIDRHSQNIFMDENLYLHILEELKSINYGGTISYSRYNEPLSHKDVFIKRLTQARAALPHARLHTNTNGDFLTREYLDDLYDAGLRSMNIQCYLKEDEAFDVENIKEKIARTAGKLDLDYRLVCQRRDRCEAVFHYKEMNLRMYARDFRINGNNRGGTLTTIKPKRRKVPCYIPFSDIYIDYNGNVMPCCNFRSDEPAHRNFILGNAGKESILRILNGKKICDLRKILINNNINIYPCNECNFATG
jgi:MoaA/NifB/PqqE/SkfB family radical SAM enzyme